MITPLSNSGYREFWLWLIRQRQRLRVAGKSMLPTLSPGDEILFDPNAYQQQRPQVGDLVVLQHPFRSDLTIVKRIMAVAESDRYFVVGDNLVASTDSRHWGHIKLSNIIGRVTSKFN